MSEKRKHPSLNVATHIIYGYRWQLILYWVIFILILAGNAIITHSSAIVGNDFDASVIWEGSSVWESASVSPKIFLMIIGILLTPLSLASFVSSGVTRRHFIGGVSIVISAYAAISALIMTLGYPIEELIYDMNGWPQELQNPHLFTSSSQPGWIFFEYFCLFFAYFGSGWLIGSGFYRFHWGIGILLTLTSLLLAMAMEAVLSSDWIGKLLQTVLEVERTPHAVVVLLAIIVMALAVVSNFLMIRHVAIKKKTF